jgi:DNA replication protein DnaC
MTQRKPSGSDVQESAIKEWCKTLRLPTMAAQSAQLAQEAEKEHQTYLGYLGALLDAEVDERERNTVERRIKDAHLPRLKTLEEFDFSQSSNVSPTRIQELAQGGYLDRAEPTVLIGECGTGKTHLLTGLCVAACRQKRRVRFATAAGLVNELVEAKHQMQLRRVISRWSRYDLIAIDEVGYVPLAEIGAEFLFQVIAERAEKAAVILTTNLPFSEWTQVIPNTRCVRRCWTALRIGHTSSRPETNRMDSDGRSGRAKRDDDQPHRRKGDPRNHAPKG